jgi:hypothetical protein
MKGNCVKKCCSQEENSLVKKYSRKEIEENMGKINGLLRFILR